MKILQTAGDERRWALKAPTHFYGLHGLTQVYPDAVLVQTHRDLVSMVGSGCSMVSKTLPINSEFRHRIGDDILESLKVVQDRGMAVRGKLTPGRMIDVRYTDLVARPMDVVAQIYQSAKMQLPADMSERIRHWLAEHPQHQHGKHVYRLEEFGITPTKVNDVLGPRELPFLTL